MNTVHRRRFHGGRLTDPPSTKSVRIPTGNRNRDEFDMEPACAVVDVSDRGHRYAHHRLQRTRAALGPEKVLTWLAYWETEPVASFPYTPIKNSCAASRLGYSHQMPMAQRSSPQPELNSNLMRSK
jgi:hypothetical protein